MQPVNFDVGQSLFQSAPGVPAAANVIAAAGTFPSADQPNLVRRGLKVVVDITAISGAGATLTVTIQGKDPLSGKYYSLLTSAALAIAGTTTLTVYPGVSVQPNVATSDVLPATWRVSVQIAGTTPSVTATIGASEIQ